MLSVPFWASSDPRVPLRQNGSELDLPASLRSGGRCSGCAPAGALSVSAGRGRDTGTARGGDAVNGTIGPRRRRRGTPHVRRLLVRLTDHEHAQLAEAAGRGPGRPLSLSRYVAEAALAAAGAALEPARQPRAPSRLALAELMDAVTVVNRVGNNLNQLAREKNITGLRPVGAREAEERALAALRRLADVAERLAGPAA